MRSRVSPDSRQRRQPEAFDRGRRALRRMADDRIDHGPGRGFPANRSPGGSRSSTSSAGSPGVQAATHSCPRSGWIPNGSQPRWSAGKAVSSGVGRRNWLCARCAHITLRSGPRRWTTSSSCGNSADATSSATQALGKPHQSFDLWHSHRYPVSTRTDRVLSMIEQEGGTRGEEGLQPEAPGRPDRGQAR
jgi:hypothetical protein